MSGISQRTLILGRVKLSGKRERIVPFPWEIVGNGTVFGWEPAEWQPMGRVDDVNRLRHKAGPNVLAEEFDVMDYSTPFFYDGNGTILHGGYVQII